MNTNIDNILICSNGKSDHDIIQDIIDNNKRDDAFFIVDIEKVIKQHQKWVAAMPRIYPHYGNKLILLTNIKS